MPSPPRSSPHILHLRTPRTASRAEPPLIIRVLTLLLPFMAGLLLFTTAYLFHLHHSHHHPEDDAADLDHYGVDHGGANSPGGSALKHKMDLAHFLIDRYDKEQHEMGRMEAEAGGWKGGSEENFIKMVNEMSHEGGGGGKKGGGGGDGDAAPKMSWEQLQRALIDNNLLPAPIPKTRTARGFSGLPLDQTPSLIGAQRGSIHCPDTEPQVEEVLSSMLAFWNEPRGDRDQDAGLPTIEAHPFIPPPLSHEEAKEPKKYRRRYLTFEVSCKYPCVVVLPTTLICTFCPSKIARYRWLEQPTDVAGECRRIGSDVGADAGASARPGDISARGKEGRQAQRSELP